MLLIQLHTLRAARRFSLPRLVKSHSMQTFVLALGEVHGAQGNAQTGRV